MRTPDSKKSGTRTSSFGTPGRVNHDASDFYNSNLYKGQRKSKKSINYRENKINIENLNQMEELPHRLIQLYTFKDEVVLDPFCGSGTTCIAALKNGRHYLGYDINPAYVGLARKRIRENVGQLSLL